MNREVMNRQMFRNGGVVYMAGGGRPEVVETFSAIFSTGDADKILDYFISHERELRRAAASNEKLGIMIDFIENMEARRADETIAETQRLSEMPQTGMIEVPAPGGSSYIRDPREELPFKGETPQPPINLETLFQEYRSSGPQPLTDESDEVTKDMLKRRRKIFQSDYSPLPRPLDETEINNAYSMMLSDKGFTDEEIRELATNPSGRMLDYTRRQAEYDFSKDPIGIQDFAEGGMAMPAPMPAAPGPEGIASLPNKAAMEAMPVEGVAQEATQVGLDPAVVQQMLGEVDSTLGDLENAESYEDVINGIREADAPIEVRYKELAGFVGEEDAMRTPESVLTMLQPVIMMAGVDQGIGALASEEMTAPVTGDMAGGIMSTVNMGQEGVPPVNFNLGGAVQYFDPANENRVAGAMPGGRLGEFYTQFQPVYAQVAGIGDREQEKKDLENAAQADLLFSLARFGLNLASPEDTRRSPAEQLAAAAKDPLAMAQVRMGELAKDKRALTERNRAANLAALQAAQGALTAETKTAADAAASAAERDWKSNENAKQQAFEILKLDKQLAFTKQENETSMNFQERLADRKLAMQLTLQKLAGSQSKEDITLRGQLQIELAKLNNAFTQQLQNDRFDFTRAERVATQDYNNSVMHQKFANDKALLALQGAQDESSIKLRQTLEQENLRLGSELRKGEYMLQFENQLQRDGIQNAFELSKMDKNQGFSLALQDHKAAIDKESQIRMQVFQAGEAALDRAQREGLQLSQQNFQKLMQEELQKFQGSEADKNRALQKAAQEVDRMYKEGSLYVSRGQLSISQAAQKLDEQYKIGKLAIDALAAKATKLGSEALTNTITYLTDPDRLDKYANGSLGAEAGQFEQLVLNYINPKNNEVWDSAVGRYVKGSAGQLAPRVLGALEKGNPAFYEKVMSIVDPTAAPIKKDTGTVGTGAEASETGPKNLGEATKELFNRDGTVNKDSPAWSLTRPNRYNPNINYGQVIGLSRMYPGLVTMASQGYAELADGVPTDAAQKHKEAQQTLTGLANDLLQFSTNIGDERVLKFVQELIEKETNNLRPGGFLLKTDADAVASLKALRNGFEQAMQIKARKLPEYGGDARGYSANMVQKDRATMDEMKVLMNEILAFEKGFGGGSVVGGTQRTENDQSIGNARNQIMQMRKK